MTRTAWRLMDTTGQPRLRSPARTAIWSPSAAHSSRDGPLTPCSVSALLERRRRCSKAVERRNCAGGLAPKTVKSLIFSWSTRNSLSSTSQPPGGAASAPLSDSDRASGAHLNELLDEIRSIPGLDGFASGVEFADVVRAATETPIVYVNPTPWGTDIVMVTRDGGVEVALLPVTSTQVVGRVLIGADLDDPDGPAPRSPSFALASTGGDIELADALNGVEAWVGEHLAGPLDIFLTRHSAGTGTLILCGPLQRLPLLACSFGPDGSTLLDRGAFALAPSAALHAASLRRANELSKVPALDMSFIGDPHPESPEHALPGSTLEQQVIATLRWNRLDCRVASAATTQAFDAAVRRGGVVHVACHARAALTDLDDVGLRLRDAALKLQQLAALDATNVRLMTLSACQTALTPLAHESEGFSIAVVLQAAGAAAVIASLWSVDDAATSLLMSRFYELLLSSSRPTPAEALRRAQLWLRDLPRDALVEALGRSPELGCIHDYDLAAKDRSRPLAHMEHWGGFVAYGC